MEDLLELIFADCERCAETIGERVGEKIRESIVNETDDITKVI